MNTMEQMEQKKWEKDAIKYKRMKEELKLQVFRLTKSN